MGSRRQFLVSAAPAVWFSSAASKPANAVDEIEHCMKRLTILLTQRYGGTWKASIDKRGEFVLVSKKLC